MPTPEPINPVEAEEEEEEEEAIEEQNDEWYEYGERQRRLLRSAEQQLQEARIMAH